MPSSEDFAKWQEAYADVVRQAKIGKANARAKLRLARTNVERARRSFAANDPDQALISAETAIVNAADAILSLSGYRIRGKSGSHEARFAFPGLPAVFSARSAEIESSRKLRNVAMYDSVGSVSVQLARDVIEAADSLVAAATATVG